MLTEDAADVLAFWFDELKPDQRFARDAGVDATIRERFGDLHARLSRHVPEAWIANPQALLAAIIVLDQFSRNLYRDDPRAFANDAVALNLAWLALKRGDDAPMDAAARQFLYMPFMHSEDADDQDRCVDLMQETGNAEAVDFAKRHKAIIDRFGRFPHRNEALGRETTTEEAAFLKEPGSSF
jgi:uncharacterized protein (DUF924 family)